jgi:carbamoylphosphate synthase large subunit
MLTRFVNTETKALIATVLDERTPIIGEYALTEEDERLRVMAVSWRFSKTEPLHLIAHCKPMPLLRANAAFEYTEAQLKTGEAL